MKPFKRTRISEFFKIIYEYDGKTLFKTIYSNIGPKTYPMWSLAKKEEIANPTLMVLYNAKNN